MKQRDIDFVDYQSTTEYADIFDAYKFRPKGRFIWLQKKAWGLLRRLGSLEQAKEAALKVTRHRIDADKFMERLYKQRGSVFRHFRQEPTRLVIGGDDYAELMGCGSFEHHFQFAAEYHRNGRVMGMTVEVVPWMTGMCVLP